MGKGRITRQEQSENGKRGFMACLLCFLAAFLAVISFPQAVQGEERVKIEFFYENVCAACEGDADFYDIYQEYLTGDEREALDAEVSTYNVFLDSCSTYYDDTVKRLGIPEGTPLPVLVIGDQWVSGYEQMGAFLQGSLEKEGTAPQKAAEETDGDRTDKPGVSAEDMIGRIEEARSLVILLFTTNACGDCEEVKEWIDKNRESLNGEILEYNIIEDDCLELLKGLFRENKIEEEKWEVPAVFYGSETAVGKAAAGALSFPEGEPPYREGNEQLADALRKAAGQESEGAGDAEGDKKVSLLTLAGTGLLAGLNPCSISMLLMLLSLILSEKASVLKNGLLYLGGKYAAYFAIGMIIYISASQISDQALGRAGQVINGILVVLFGIAGVLYLADAVKICRQDYGHIRTQLPVGLRRMNHQLIRRTLGRSGALQPLLIVGLGVAISLGEFFCTGQIYMASITYLLKDRNHGVWAPFLVYVTAMSLPAFAMILMIQRTRNTERVSEFMLRRLGAVKLLNAVLFFGFMAYFVFR